MSDEISLVTEPTGAAWTFVRFGLWSRSNVVRIVVQVHMTSQQLLLAERLLTQIALEWLLIGMNQQM